MEDGGPVSLPSPISRLPSPVSSSPVMNVISVENLSKSYRLGQINTGTFSRDLEAWWARLRGRPNPHLRIGETDPLLTAKSAKSAKEELNPGGLSGLRGSNGEEDDIVWALRDVSFTVEQGEVLGIIGRNGAGKSTLLKILSRVTAPTSGRIRVKGRVASLLEVGTGFHPELTGRENTYLNGAILGMSRREIDRKFDEIVDFAGVEKYIDTPVKRYSSGMYVRLAFAVAAHLDPEILVVDEVLAVGDAEFQKKCLGKMGEVAQGGRTVLFVSHNMAAIENLCGRTLLIHQGKIIKDAPTRIAIEHYLETILDSAVEGISLADRIDRRGTGDIKLTSFHIENKQRKKVTSITTGEDLIFVFGYKTKKNGVLLRNIDVGFSIHSIANNQTLCVLYSSYVGVNFNDISKAGTFRCQVPKFPLAPGRYRVGARIVVNSVEADWPQDGIGYIDIESGDYYGTGSNGFGGNAPFMLLGNWQLESK
ncbi:MAG: ABC transporter ATP-binding protein [Chloroflexota bacterium]|nr:MAG: ABC transporter ATP-binding protein [Chloroflexota bacterium]